VPLAPPPPGPLPPWPAIPAAPPAEPSSGPDRGGVEELQAKSIAITRMSEGIRRMNWPFWGEFFADHRQVSSPWQVLPEGQSSFFVQEVRLGICRLRSADEEISSATRPGRIATELLATRVT
jgi:hypothetical protein